ncbi:hypothetical protein [Lactobacillus amylovorus]|uniref:hypothetical protein n=1 Tax=Lactobacillus amylovorus TaxID=1604 RepID=UPI003F8F6552
MNTNEFKLKLTSRAAQDSVSALIEMNNMVGYVTHVNDSARDAKFYDTVKKAYYFATQTELDFGDIDEQIQDILLVLLIESKLAYDYFHKGCNDSETIRLLELSNHCATEQLMVLKN